MSEFTPQLHGDNGYNIEESQRFLECVGQFDRGKLQSDLARNLLGLGLVWEQIDDWIAAVPPDGTDASNERVYSGFSESGDYFEAYGFPLRFGHLLGEEERTLYTGNLLFHANLGTGNISTLLPDISYDEASMQLRFFPGPGVPSATANKFNDEMGSARLTIATVPGMPPEDFSYSYRGRRQVLLDTKIFQQRTGLYSKVLRACVYQPENPSYHNIPPPDEDEGFVHVDI